MKGVRSLVAAPCARVREGGAHHRNESPRVAGIAERQLENAEDDGVAHLTVRLDRADRRRPDPARAHRELPDPPLQIEHARWGLGRDRKSTRLNSSHMSISYAVFCLKKKKKI